MNFKTVAVNSSAFVEEEFYKIAVKIIYAVIPLAVKSLYSRIFGPGPSERPVKRTVVTSQVAYDAGPKDPDTLYLITS